MTWLSTIIMTTLISLNSRPNINGGGPMMVEGGWPTRELEDVDQKIKAVFYDFDRTLLTISYGHAVQIYCNSSNTLTTSNCKEKDEFVNAYKAAQKDDIRTDLHWEKAFEPQPQNTYYKNRLERLRKHLKRVKGQQIKIYMCSTSWMPIPKSEWRKMIRQVMIDANLESYFPLENILTLDDPGLNIPANKGAVIKAKLKELRISKDQSLFADDSEGNTKSAMGITDILYLSERKGLDFTDFGYIEERAKFRRPAKYTCDLNLGGLDHMRPTGGMTWSTILILCLNLAILFHYFH